MIDYNRAMVTHLWMVELLEGDHAAALLLNQCVYWWIKMGKPYWKYIEAPAGDYPENAYKDGESWSEEMCMSRRQFERARDKIAKKVKRPAGMLTVKYDKHGQLLPVNRIVIYWQVTNSQTKYAVNMPLLYEYQRMWLGEFVPLGAVDIAGLTLDVPEDNRRVIYQNANGTSPNGESDFTKTSNPNTEDYTEDYTTESIPDARRDLFLAVAQIHKAHKEDDTMTELVKDDVLGYMAILDRLGGFGAADVLAFPAWYGERNRGKALPKKPETFEFYYSKYKAELIAGREAEDKESQRDSDLWERPNGLSVRAVR